MNDLNTSPMRISPLSSPPPNEESPRMDYSPKRKILSPQTTSPRPLSKSAERSATDQKTNILKTLSKSSSYSSIKLEEVPSLHQRSASANTTTFLSPRSGSPINQSSPVSSPRLQRFIPRINQGPFTRTVAQFDTSADYPNIQYVTGKLGELKNILIENESRQTITWCERSLIFNKDDVQKAITKLEIKLDKMWEQFIKKLWEWKLDSSELVFDSTPKILRNVYGEKIEITFVQALEPGGFHHAYVVQVNEIEYVLLVSINGLNNDQGSSEWKKEQIEEIIWRENLTRQLHKSNLTFFPKHMHTFVLKDSNDGLPAGCYLLEKLDPLKPISKKNSFCRKAISALDELHANLKVHGDMKTGNILQKDDRPKFIDFDYHCYSDFSTVQEMSLEEQTKWWDRIKETGISGRYTLPQFRILLHSFFVKTNSSGKDEPLKVEHRDRNGLFEFLKVKDCYGLAIALWEIYTDQNINALYEKCHAPSQNDDDDGINPKETLTHRAVFAEIKSSLDDVDYLSHIIKDWIIKSILDGLKLTDDSLAKCHSAPARISLASSSTSKN